MIYDTKSNKTTMSIARIIMLSSAILLIISICLPLITATGAFERLLDSLENFQDGWYLLDYSSLKRILPITFCKESSPIHFAFGAMGETDCFKSGQSNDIYYDMYDIFDPESVKGLCIAYILGAVITSLATLLTLYLKDERLSLLFSLLALFIAIINVFYIVVETCFLSFGFYALGPGILLYILSCLLIIASSAFLLKHKSKKSG